MATTINGTIGNDVINRDANAPVNLRTNPFNRAEAVTVNALSGFDEVYGSTNADLLFGNTGDDTIYGNGGSDTIYGGQADDDIYVDPIDETTTEQALAVRALAVGGQGFDQIFVGTQGWTNEEVLSASLVEAEPFTGQVTVYGGSQSSDTADEGDEINVNLGVNSYAEIYGNGGNDTIDVEGGSRSLAGDQNARFFIAGGQGNDSIDGDVGSNSTVYGGVGTDTIYLDAENSVTVYGGNGSNSAIDGDDTIYVDLYKDEFFTGVPTASIFGNGGADTLDLDAKEADVRASVYGGQGNDTIDVSGEYRGSVEGGYYGLASNSLISGGLGADEIDVRVNGDDVSVYGGNGTDDPTDGADTIEVRVTAGGSASIYGNGGDDYIEIRGKGSSTAFGGAGDDTFDVRNRNEDQGELPEFVSLTGGRGSDLFDIEARESDTRETGAFVRITDFNFDQDRIEGELVSTLRTVSGEAGNFNGIVNLAGPTDNNTAALVTVTSGNLAGTYLVYENGFDTQVVNITGYTGTADADVFVSA